MKNPWTLVTQFGALALGLVMILACFVMEIGLGQLPFYFQISASLLVFGGSLSFAAFAHAPVILFQAMADVFGALHARRPEDLDRSARVFQTLGEISVPMGWTGALIGTISMLQNLASPKQIGSAMSLALICSVYGFFFRAALCIPCHEMLRGRAKEAQA